MNPVSVDGPPSRGSVTAVNSTPEDKEESTPLSQEVIPSPHITNNITGLEQDNVQRVSHVDGSRVVGLSEEDEAFYNTFTAAQRNRVRLKTDLRLLPVLCILYLFAQLDRANIANAKIEGFKEDTGLTNRQYNIILAIFFVPYFLLEVPSNMLLKTLNRPSLYISFLVVAWGITMTCHGFANDFGGVLSLRLLLGIFESGFFPAAMYICSQWYQRHELAFRLSLFMAVASLSGAFAGFMAAGIAQMGGLGGYESWRWIFLVEGGITIVLGLLTFFFLVDSPRRSGKWLEPHEIRYLETMAFIKDGGLNISAQGPSKLQDLKSIVMDWRYWAFGLLLHNVASCGYGLKFAVPSIIRGMGYTKAQSQLLSAIPYIFGTISAVAVSFASDKVARRSYFVAAGLSSIALGFGIILAVVNSVENKTAGVIAGMCFVTSGVFPMAPINGSWISNNFGTSSRRAVGLAFCMAIGSIGGLTGSFMYDEHDSPHFHLAFGLSLGFALTSLFIVALLVWSYLSTNKKRDEIPEQEIRMQYTEAQLMEMGDKSPLFRFTL